MCFPHTLFCLLFPDCAALTGPCCRAVDAASKAFSFEETARTGLLLDPISGHGCVCVCARVYLAGWGIPCYICLGFDTHVSFRGSKANLMHPFQVVMIPSSWIHIMIRMVMRSSSSVRFLCISLFIPLNLCLEQCQIQLPIFVYGL